MELGKRSGGDAEQADAEKDCTPFVLRSPQHAEVVKDEVCSPVAVELEQTLGRRSETSVENDCTPAVSVMASSFEGTDQLSPSLDLEQASNFSDEVLAKSEALRQRCKLLLGVAVLASLLLTGILFHNTVAAVADGFLKRCADLGWGAAVLLALMVALLNVLMLPTFPLIVAAGPFFSEMYGLWLGSFVGVVSIFAGMWLGSIAAFQLGRALWWSSRKGEGKEESEIFQEISKLIDEEGVKIVLLARMSPLLPAEAFNYACSITTLTLGQYSAGCLGSLVPISILVVSAAQAADATGHGDHLWRNMVLIAINVLIVVVLTLTLYQMYSKLRKRRALKARSQAVLEATQSNQAENV